MFLLLDDTSTYPPNLPLFTHTYTPRQNACVRPVRKISQGEKEGAAAGEASLHFLSTDPLCAACPQLMTCFGNGVLSRGATYENMVWHGNREMAPNPPKQDARFLVAFNADIRMTMPLLLTISVL